MSYKNLPEGNLDEMALTAINNRGGNSHHYAALTYKLLTKAGHQARIVHGAGAKGAGTQYWNQVNLNGEWFHLDTLMGRYLLPDNQLYTIYPYCLG